MENDTSKREFVFLDTETIERDRPDRTAVKTLVGTRKVHSIKNIVGEPFTVLQHRNLCCFCDGCRNDPVSACGNMSYVDPWEETSLKIGASIL